MSEQPIHRPSLGEAIARLRRERRWSQRELARRAHVSAALVAQIESGEITNPGIITLANILHALGVNLVFAEHILGRRRPNSIQDEILILFHALPPSERRALLHKLLDAL